jgi:hypothetical protein
MTWHVSEFDVQNGMLVCDNMVCTKYDNEWIICDPCKQIIQTYQNEPLMRAITDIAELRTEIEDIKRTLKDIKEMLQHGSTTKSAR